jgi:hypothetical protein
MRKFSIVYLALVLVTGCPAPDTGSSSETPQDPSSPPNDPPTDPPVDPPIDPPTGPLRFEGMYLSDGVWDLSDAIAADSLGDVLAVLVIDRAVSVIGPPSFLEDELRDALTALAHDPIADFVDANTPDVLDPSTGALAELAEILSQVEVTSEIVLTADPNNPNHAIGTETIVALRLRLGTQSVAVPLQNALPAIGADGLESDISATVFDGTGLSFSPQEFALVTDPLANLGLSGLLSISDLEAFAANALDCDAIVASVAGGNGLSVEVLGQSFSISTSSLVDGCETVRAEALEQIFGLFRTEIGILTEGPATMHDNDFDLVVDRLTAEPGYIGTITALPDALESDFEIVFEAERQ